MAATDESKFTYLDVAQLVSYNHETGDLSWAADHPSDRKRGRQIASRSNGYIVFRLLGGHAAAHRVAWLLHYKEWPRHHIDHINGDRSDNRIANLRDVSSFANARNKDSVKTGRMVGAVPSERGWDAVVLKYATATTIGTFATASEATEAAAVEQEQIKKPLRPRPQVRPLARSGKK